MLEAGSVIEDFKEIGLLLDGQVFAFILNFIIDSFNNTLQAFMWPVNIVQLAPPYGAIGLGVAFVLFPKYLKTYIDAWLFSDAEGNEEVTDAE